MLIYWNCPITRSIGRPFNRPARLRNGARFVPAEPCFDPGFDEQRAAKHGDEPRDPCEADRRARLNQRLVGARSAAREQTGYAKGADEDNDYNRIASGIMPALDRVQDARRG